MSDAQVEAIKKRMKEKGIEPVFLNCGVLAPTGDEAKTRRMFENLKRLGIEVMVCEPAAKDMEELAKVMDVIEKLAVEFKIKVAIHDHPKPNFYWNPETVAAAVKGRSELLGACADVGHWKRSGLDPVECLKKLEGRIIALHFKDLATDPGKTALHDVPWGTGQSNARGMLEELKRQKFKGAICVEYEHNWMNSSPEIEESRKWFEKTCEELAK
jgi:sugar phosphate isomerase/epimerase